MGQKCGCICSNKSDVLHIENGEEGNSNYSSIYPIVKLRNAEFTKEETKTLGYLIKAQAFVKSSVFRICFKKMKPEMVLACRKFINKKVETVKSIKVIQAENLFSAYSLSNIVKDNQNQDLYYKYYKELGPIVKKNRNLYTEGFITSSNEVYIGNVDIKNKMNGEGVLYSPNGSYYKGQFLNNRILGYGRMIDAEGNLLEGFFIDSKLDGIAKLTKLSGSYYYGTFVKGVKHGKGKEETQDHIYEGSFVDDKKEGKGKIFYKKTKDYYEGDFLNNTINGSGIYNWSNKNVYKGTFKNGKMHGQGFYKWPDGSEYEGQYFNNLKEGNGRFRWNPTREFIGPFTNGKPHGLGRLTSDGMNYSDAEFFEGKLISKK